MSVLEEAIEATRERPKGYGHPKENFELTAELWESMLGTPVTPLQVGLCMIALKLAREVHRHKRDNLVDIAGYAAATARALGEDP